MQELKRCSKCLMPDTWPGIHYDDNGVCNICKEHDIKVNINWNDRQTQFKLLLDRFKDYAKLKGNKYNCLVGYSGGKDTAYTLWAMVKKYHMKPLAFTFNHGFNLSPEAQYNLYEIPKLLDVDHITFTLGNNFRNSLCKHSSIIMGDFCWHCHAGVGAMPAKISKQWDIPLQIWGEPTAEYQTVGSTYSMNILEEQDYNHYLKAFVTGNTPDKMIPKGYTIEDMKPLVWDAHKKLKAVYLGSYEPWDQYKNVEIIMKELKWKVRKSEVTYTNFDKVDCPLEDLREYQKYIRRGFGKVSFQVAKDIRNGMITREQGLYYINEYEGRTPSTLYSQLKELGMTKEEFDKITNRNIRG